MALIGTIRKNGWILIATMVLALGGFILMDVVSNSQRYAAGDANSLGKVNGKELNYKNFEEYRNLIYANSTGDMYQIRQQVWDYMVEQELINKEAGKIGLGVSTEELMDLQFGDNLSPLMLERFGQNGQPNRQALANIKQRLETGQFDDPTSRSYWAVQEKEIVKDRLQSKLMGMITKGLYTPSWQAEMSFRETNERLTFVYTRVPYDKIPDSEIQVTDADYNALLKENPRLYDQLEETRTIDYAVYDVVPTGADTSASRKTLTDLVDKLRETKTDSIFAALNNGVYDGAYKTKAQLATSPVADSLMRLPVGSVVGPYLDGSSWNLVKVVDRKTIPDSVRARHILIRSSDPAAMQKVDSLMAVLAAGKASFDSLAMQNGTDATNVKGGDLGWFGPGAMVPEFNDLCFYKADQGKVYKVVTQFGVHMLEVTGKKFIKNESGIRTLTLTQRVEPSTSTQQIVKDKALAIVQQAKNATEMASLVGMENIAVQAAPNVVSSEYQMGVLGSGDDVREVLRWAFNKATKPGSVSKEVFVFRDPAGGYFDSKYVVASLKSITPAGKATASTLKNSPAADLIVKNRKKAEAIKSKLQNAGDLDATAAQWGVKVDTTVNAYMLQTYIPNGGVEPRVMGTAFALAKDAVSAPITGNTGVYLVRVIKEKPTLTMPSDMTMFRTQMASAAESGVKINFMRGLKKAAKVVDNRSKFF